MFRTFCVRSKGPMPKLVLFCSGTLMRLEIGFCVAFCRSPVWSSTAGFCCARTAGDNARTATSCIKNRLWIRLFIFPPHLSERDTPHKLKGISLDGGRVREFLE